ncbi:MAG: hypothetical protein JWN21_2084 [Sphingomonas bacterium]|uniref:hypothetical protein n=1 Tax=Sphingomonas bacterium TaxID=1895847 RepID=UPI0026046696|nr:hypothetical protein [Sphingomonas bacterium]MDB5696541.1 hypothetical protein [Sphingomonas bacterium]
MVEHPAASRVTLTDRVTPSTLVLDGADAVPLPDDAVETEQLELEPPVAFDLAIVRELVASTSVTITLPSLA